MLEPLPVGSYNLSFGGSFYGGGFQQDNHYRLVVGVPGPLPILGVATAFSYSRRMRKRIKSAPPVATATD